jgi:hypothetical protein
MMSDPNLPLLEEAALKLKPFLEEIVFVGGVTLGLLITDQGAAPIRGTNDVDVIAEILTYTEYIVFSERLRKEHFTEDMSEKPIACRWRHGGLTLDVLPLDEKVLGYTNIWYQSALKEAHQITLPGGLIIKVITAPFFLGTKMEAFRGRGNSDFLASHDLEDFVAVIDGRNTILEEIANAPADLKAYLAETAKGLLQESRFREVLPGYVLGDEASQQRIPLILQRLTEMTQLVARV